MLRRLRAVLSETDPDTSDETNSLSSLPSEQNR